MSPIELKLDGPTRIWYGAHMARRATSSALWRAFQDNEITHSGAHYLLAIGAAAKEGLAPRAAMVARALGVSRAAVSVRLRSLSAQGFLRVDPTQRLHLTRAGADLVARILSKREIVRAFLREILGVREATAEADACKIEHLLSEETRVATVRLSRFLQSDHPAAKACLKALRATTARCPPEGRCELCGVRCILTDAPGTGGRSATRNARVRPRPGRAPNARGIAGGRSPRPAQR
jgi:DtxR family transcriptional regulator, Mn-dependent transcriptional regulator